MTSDDILDDLFHFCAWQAYLEVAGETGSWPDSEAARRRAYRLYEESLAAKNTPAQDFPRGKSPPAR
jgi:hypothetical protein